MNLILRLFSNAVFFIAAIVVIESPSASELEQWGLVTKNKASSPPAAAPDSAGGQPAPVADRRETGAPDRSDHAARQPATRPGVAPSGTPTPLGSALLHKNKKESGHSASTRKNGTPPTALHWESPQQKETCETYLFQMRELFLKTRHYSIQGASCATAESATAFAALSEKCSQQCPAGTLAQGGYTHRILRNIDYLEKLGRDRCGPAAPPISPEEHENPQMSQRPAEPSAILQIEY